MTLARRFAASDESPVRRLLGLRGSTGSAREPGPSRSVSKREKYAPSSGDGRSPACAAGLRAAFFARAGNALALSALVACTAVTCSRVHAQSADPSEASALRDLDRFGDEPAADSGKPRTPISQVSLEELLHAYSHEPKVEQVIAAALEAAKHDPAKYAEMASRARLRGLLPHVDLGARRGQGIDLRWTPTEDLDAHRTTADDVTLFATLRFDLDRLMFTGEEVSIAREARSAKNAEHQLIRAVVHVYFLRRRLMLERDMLAGSSIAQQLRIQEAEALLDAFTDGAFQRMLKDGKHKAWRTGASTNASERQ